MSSTDSTVAPYVVALRRNKQRRTRKKAAFLLVAVSIATWIGLDWWQSLDHFPVIATTTLNDGTELRLHAVLQPGDPDFPLPNSTVFSRSLSKINNSQNTDSLVLILSHRSSDTAEWLGFDWFDSLSINDRHGVPVPAFNETIRVTAEWHTPEGHRRSFSNTHWIETEIPDRLPERASFRFLVAHLCMPDVDGVPVVEFHAPNRPSIASMEIPVDLPKPESGFETAACSFKTRNKNWASEIYELEYSEPRGRAINDGRWSSQANIGFKADFKYKDKLLFREQTVLGPTYFSDAMGNTYQVSSGLHQFANRMAIPYGPTVWKLRTTAARNTNADLTFDELTLLGRFEVADKSQLVKTATNSAPRHLVILPPGEQEFFLAADKFSFLHRTDRAHDRHLYGQYALGTTLSSLPNSSLQSSSFGGNGSGLEWEDESWFSMTLGQGNDEITVSAAVFSSSSQKGARSTTTSPWPLVMLALPPNDKEWVHHLVVRDKTGAEVPIRPCLHPIKNIPIYAMHTKNAHEQPLSFFYHSEPFTELEFIIPSPHTVIERPEDPTWTFSSKLVPNRDKWQQIDSWSSDTVPPQNSEQPSHE